MKKILSVILSLLITVQLAIIIPALASSQSGEAAGALLINDFSEYSLVTSKSGANDFRNALDWEGTWAVKNDASAKGGNYLSFSHGEKTANYTSGFAFVANPTGSATAEGSWQLASNSKYRLTVRYRVSGITTEGNALRLMLAVPEKENTYSITNAGSKAEYIKYVDSDISNTDGWVTATYAVDTSDMTIPKNSNLFLGFRPIYNGNNCYPDKYTVDIDYFEISDGNAIAADEEFTARHMEIGFEKYSIPASGMGAVYNSTNASYTIAEENGDKYLSFSKTGSVKWTASYALLLNPNGKAKDNSEKGSYKMENGAKYRVSFRYKLSSADGSCSGVPVALGYSTTVNTADAASGIWSTNAKQDAVYAKEGSTDVLLRPTEDWQTFTYDFTMDRIAAHSGSGKYMTPYLCFAAGSNWSTQKSASYNFSIDDIVVDRLAEVTLSSGEIQTKIYGVPQCIADKDSVYSDCDGEVYSFDSTQTEVYKENEYTEGDVKWKAYTASVGAVVWYKNSEMTEPVGDSYTFTAVNKTLYSGSGEIDEDLVAFCGFDEYYLRTWKHPGGTPWNYYGYGWDPATPGSWVITDEAAYSGKKSIKTTYYGYSNEDNSLNSEYNFNAGALYVGSGYEFVSGSSYEISFYIKKNSTVQNQHGKLNISIASDASVYHHNRGTTVENVVLTDEWQKISMSWTAVMGSDATACAPALVLSGTGMHSFYIDTVEIKEVCSRADINDENYPSEWQNNANYYKSFKITDADAHSGSGSFVTTAKNAFMRLSYNDKAIRVSNGTVYLMSFWYKASSGTPEISFVTADAENVSSGAVKQASYKTAKSDKGKWKKAYVLFTAAPQGSNNTLWLSVSGADKLNIDDIKLTTSTEIVFNTMGGTMNGTEICTVLGTPGATASYSAPVKDGMYFYGWYQDAALTKKCGALTFPSDSDSITVYAKWVDSLPAAIVDFEDAPYGSDNSKWGSNTSTFFSPTVAEIITEDKHSDSKSLRLHFDPEKIKAVGSNITYNSPTLAFGMYDNVGNPMYIEKGKIYKVTLWYKAEKADCNLTVTAMATHNKNFWAYNLRTVYDDTAYTIKMSEAGGDWTKAEIYVNADEIITSDTQWGRLTGNHMFIWLRASSNKAFSVLFDDVIVEELPENIGVNIYQSNNGSNPVYTVGGVGTAVTLPKEPTRKNYTFGGWYTDKNCTQKYNGGSYKSNALLLYAKWNMNDTVVVDFEDEYYTSSLNGNQQTRASVATNFGHNSNSSMLVSKEGKLTSGDHWSGMIAVVGEVPFKVEKGATYMISYDYYVVRNKVAATASNTPHPYVRVANEKNIWLNYDDPNTGWYMGSTEKTGTWLTASFIYTADIPEGKDDTLYFTVNASQDFIGYFDNIRISKVDKGNGSILLLNPCGAESTGNMKLMYIGKNASAVTLPASTLVKKDYTFVGWYRDPALTVPFTDKSFSFIGEDTTLYAAWSKNTNLQDFEDYKSYGKTEALNYMDFDYEIYDLTSGNKDKSNVHSGNVSIHRIGNDHHFAAFQIFSAAASPSSRLVSGNVYKLSMWVKLESARHSTGAVKIASCSDAEYAWRISGEWLNVAAIKDLPAGEWKKIEYTFYANDGFLSIQTPGYVSMYIDDVTLEIKSNLKASDCSESLEIEEYVPRRLNADGTYDEEEITPIDLSCVKVSGAYAGTKDGNGNNTLWIVIAIVGGVVLAGAAATAAVIILKHRKTRR